MLSQQHLAQQYFYEAIKSGNRTRVHEYFLFNPKSLRDINNNVFQTFYGDAAKTYGYVDPAADNNHAMILAAKHGQLDIVILSRIWSA